MKKSAFIASLLFCVLNAFTQNIAVDSFRAIIYSSSADSLKIDALYNLANYYRLANPDSAIALTQKGLTISIQMNAPRRHADFLFLLASEYGSRGNFPESIKLSLEALEIDKTINNPIGIAREYWNIARTYQIQKDFVTSLKYLGKARVIQEQIKDSTGLQKTLDRYGSAYLAFGQLDSAEYYFKRATQIAILINDEHLIGATVDDLGLLYEMRNEDAEAMKYYRMSMPYLVKTNDLYNIAETAIGMATLFKKAGNSDSCIYYAKMVLKIAENTGYLEYKYDVGILLSEYYKEKRNMDSAFFYQQIAIEAKDSLFSQDKTRQVQNIAFNEQLRQNQIKEVEDKYKSSLKIYALLGGLLMLLILAAVLIRNNKQKQNANIRLQEQNETIASTLQDLKATQSQLIQSEKMASLGELTAGIAHEIQNPLNFINNFSEVNTELLQELKRERLNGNAEKNNQEEEELLNNLINNEEKINHHGKRADTIVKGMLRHSRGSSGQKEPTDINQMATEFLGLAWHGFRAKDKTVNINLQSKFDAAIGQINIVPEDLGRVLLNLFNNALYAVSEKAKTNSNGYEPAILLTTKRSGDQVEISIEDNGSGISQKIINKIFQPFFTTKPTGQGTGLGLSMSYDMIKSQGGDLKVVSHEGAGAEFIIVLPNA